MKKVAILGGGISGLSAAYFLQEQSQIPLEISLFEEKPRLGGVIESDSGQGYVMEFGPDCFLSKKPAAQDLMRRLGLEKELIPTREGFRRSFIYLNQKLIATPEGFYLIAPRHWMTFLKMSHLSLWGKLRAAREWFIPRFENPDDESIESFICRRFGKEIFERLGQPMIGGIYGGAPDRLSLKASLPQFAEMERKHGGVLRGLAKQKDEAHQNASGPRYSLFLSMKQGMEQMTRGLAKELRKVKIYSACGIRKISKKNSGYELQAEDGRTFEADAVIAALPAYRTAALIADFAEELAEELKSIPFQSMATVNLVYRRSDIPAHFKGVGFVVPKIERTNICACTYASLKFEGRETQDQVLLRAFAGGALYPEIFKLDDHGLEHVVREDLKKILNVTAAPLRVEIRRYPNSMPQYEVGHLEKVKRIQKLTAAHSGLFLTGNSYEGTGIPDCIQQSEKQVASLLSFFRS